MAATRLIALHRNKGKSVLQTLTDRTNYTKNPDKTQDGALVIGYECDPRTVNEEFLLTKHLYDQISGLQYRNEVIAYQIRQSFKPGEVTPEEANEIGKELALRFTKGKFAFIVATHTDRAHIHNHIIFNSTRLDGKRKFKDFWFSGLALQRLSDLICLEHGLSVITPRPVGERAKRSDFDRQETARDRIVSDIDDVLASHPSDFNDFLNRLSGVDYEIKTGKHIAVKSNKQKKFIRLDSLKEGYRENDLRARFSTGTGSITPKRQISLMIDIQKKMREKGVGYARWATVFNLKQMAKTLLFLREHSIETADQLKTIVEEYTSRENVLLEKVKSLEKRLGEIAKLRKHITDYIETKDVYVAYRKNGYSKKFLEAHRDEIIRYKEAREAFDKFGSDIPKLKDLGEEYKIVLAEKRSAYSEYRSEREKTKEVLIVQENIRSFYRSVSEPPEFAKNEKQR